MTPHARDLKLLATPGATARSVLWRLRGELHVTVAVEATFSFVDGAAMTHLAPREPSGGRPAPYVPRADVLLSGRAHPSASHVRLGIFHESQPVLDKSIAVHHGGSIAAPPSAHDRDAWLGDSEIVDIPEDVDWTRFQLAPPNQTVDFPRGDEWIVIEGLFTGPRCVRTRLPRARGLLRIHGLSSFGRPEGESIPLHLDELHLDGDEQRCTAVWRGHFVVPSEDALACASLAAGVEIEGEPVAWPAAPEPETHTVALSPEDFEIAARAEPSIRVDGGTSVGGLEPERMPPPYAPVDLRRDPDAAMGAQTIAISPAQLAESARDALPFTPASHTEARASVRQSEPPSAPSDTGTVTLSNDDIERLARSSPLPFPSRDESEPADGLWTRERVIARIHAGKALDGLSLDGLDLSDLDFSSCSLVAARLENATLVRCKLRGANLSRATLTRANLGEAELTRAILSGARADGASWKKANLTGASFERASLRGASFARATCDEADFTGADLGGSDLRRASLRRAMLTGVNLEGATLERADLSGCDARGAKLSDTNVWKATTEGARLTEPLPTDRKIRTSHAQET